ncbi:WLM domain-containing protein [Halenospora varia]|nr:WLM domain-containing protein [Halenospora varia]
MLEHDPLVLEYSHLKNHPREKDALEILKKIASLVKPIMRARNWKVGVLAEFYPDQQNLLGINQNRGQKICLRLRYPGDVTQFLPLEQVVDTMLHELAHNVHGPHNAEFHALWDQQRKEYEALIAKGYTGEGFLSDGHKLGGGRIPMHEARRLARVAAEKRATLYAGSGQRLGGRPVRVGTDIRKVIVEAIERRSTVLKGCGSDNRNEDEIKDLADQATRNGFKTKAEEDKANEEAIAQAMWELVQEDQKKEYGDSYIPSSAANPTGNGGGEIGASQPPRAESSRAASQSKPVPKREPPRHVSRLVTESAAKKPKPLPKNAASTSVTAAAYYSPSSALSEAEQLITGWTCEICTLHNPITYLCCDACTTERSPEITKKIAAQNKKAAPVSRPVGLNASTWTCTRCTTIMQNQWWTCSTCGKLKESS